ncbi:MAG: hypothetical protein QXF56_04045 [Candidatus Micrarchaeia archaeon]
MKYLVGLVVLIVVLAALYLLYGVEQRVSLSEFKNELAATNKISIIMDTRHSPITIPVMQCGTDVAMMLGLTGKYDALRNRTFVYEGETCFYGNTTKTIKECESIISGSTVFYIRYNQNKNSTAFYKSKAVVEGDSDFLNDCAIARMIG